jgi:hypothetical protein
MLTLVLLLVLVGGGVFAALVRLRHCGWQQHDVERTCTVLLYGRRRCSHAWEHVMTNDEVLYRLASEWSEAWMRPGDRLGSVAVRLGRRVLPFGLAQLGIGAALKTAAAHEQEQHDALLIQQQQQQQQQGRKRDVNAN